MTFTGRTLYSFLLAATMAASAWAQSPLLFRDAAGAARRNTASAVAEGALRSRTVDVDGGLLAESDGEQPAVTYNLFPDVSFEVRRVRAYHAGDAAVWLGEVKDSPGSQVTVTSRDGVLSGNITMADGVFYRIRPQADGTHRIDEVDVAAMMARRGDDALEPPEDLVPRTEDDSSKQAAARRDASSAQAATSTIDIMVLYTAEARQAAGGDTAIRNLISLSVAEANQGYVNSGIDITLRLVHAAEAAPSSGQEANGTYLDTVTRSSSIGALRNQYGADVVSVWINGPGSRGGTVGIAWSMRRASISFASSAFNVVELNFAAGPSYTFAHEVGHILGSAHDRDHSSSPGVYPYSYGMQQPAGTVAERFVTIMAYSSGCSNCAGINHWSNPDVRYAGRPTGIAASESNSADNRLTLNQTRLVAELFRDTVGGPPPPPAPPPAQTPVPASISPSAGTGTQATFAAVVTDGNGAADITEARLLVSRGFTGASACSISLRMSDRAVFLRNDGDTGWLGPATAGASSTLVNAQCTLALSGVTVTPSGNSLTVRFPLTFAAAFAGARDLNVRGLDATGRDSAWQKLGSWTIPEAATAGPAAPTVVSLTPATGAGSTATFTAVFNDVNGGADIRHALFLVNGQLSSGNGCYVYLLPASRRVYLLNDTGRRWLGPAVVGQGTLSNSQCTVDSAAMTVDVNGTRLTVRYPLRFLGGFRGLKNVYPAAVDRTGRFSGWSAAGTFTAQ